MPELELDDESKLRDMILDNLDDKERELFVQVHRFNRGCAIMGYLDAHPNELLTMDDLSFHLQESTWVLEPGVRGLAALGLLRRMDVQDMTFFGLTEETATRRKVHELFNWQRGWHTRLARVENLVDGHLHT